MTDDTTQAQAAQHHTLPRWLHWVQSHLFLSFLLLAEAYLLGDLMQRGWVGNIEDFTHWGVYHGVGVVLFFAAGAMAAGVALQCSVTAAEAFQTRHPFLGLFNLVGVLVFAGSEIWASLSERSANLRPSPADQAVLAMLNVQGLPISPTVIVVALLLPFATLYYGFSQRKPPQETAQERHERQERELADAQHKAALREVRVTGMARAGRAALQAAKGEESAVQSTDNDGAMAVQEAPDSIDNEPVKAPTMRGRGAGRGAVPSDMMSAPQFRAYLAENGVSITAERAAAMVQGAAGFQKIGTANCARKAALMRLANRLIDDAQGQADAEPIAG